MIKSGEITRFKFHLSYLDPYSNTKKCPNVLLEVKQELKQLLDQKNKEKAKKATYIEEIRSELRGTMRERDRHLIDDDEDEKEKEEDVYMYPGDMNVPLMRALNLEQHVMYQKLANGTDNKKNDLRETKE